MSGVIDEDGQQWEHCNGCTKFVKIQHLAYEGPSAKFEYGRDLCPACARLSAADPGCDIEPDPESVRLREEARARIEAEMRGRKHVFTETEPGVFKVDTVSVN